MNQEKLINVILGPVVSEKANGLSEKRGQIVLTVRKDATKSEIKSAVELLLDVEVASVNTTTIKGKVKRFGRHVGRRSDVKKAYISLVPGQDLDLESAAAKSAE